MMTLIYLHGYAARYGACFELNVDSPREAVRALSMQIDGFEDMIREGEWHILRGPLELGDDYDEETLDMSLGDAREIHIMPAIRGAGNGGGGLTTILGIIVLAVATFFTGGAATALYFAGAGLIVGGIIQMTMKIPGADTDTESTDNKASFLFAGPKNQSTQGVAIPRGYGRCRVGSIVVSAGLYAEDLAT